MEQQDLGVVLYEKDGHVARIVLNNPAKANAQDHEMVEQFDDALTLAERDYEVKVVVIKANGKGFCAGHAIGGAGDPYPAFTEEREEWGVVWKSAAEYFLHPVLRLWEFPKPTIAQVQGYAIGGGSYWALLPDITIAADDAYFQMPLVQGFGFPGGETMMEPWLFMNWKKAYEYLYTAETLSAEQAAEAGIVNRVVPLAELDATVDEMAERIARAPASTLSATKQLVSRAWELMGLRTHWKMSNDVMALLGHTKDASEFRANMMAEGKRPRDMTD